MTRSARSTPSELRLNGSADVAATSLDRVEGRGRAGEDCLIPFCGSKNAPNFEDPRN